jgi:hypothetical protein
MSVAHPFGNNEFGQFAPNRFGARETENVLGREVELAYPAGRIHRDDAIERRIKDGTIERLEPFGRINNHVLLFSAQMKSLRHRLNLARSIISARKTNGRPFNKQRCACATASSLAAVARRNTLSVVIY